MIGRARTSSVSCVTSLSTELNETHTDLFCIFRFSSSVSELYHSQRSDIMVTQFQPWRTPKTHLESSRPRRLRP
jgi:hypothetical protein